MEYLGVVLDSVLSFDSHIDYIFGKSVKQSGILHKARD